MWLRTEIICAVGKYQGGELLAKLLEILNEYELRIHSDEPNGGDYAS